MRAASSVVTKATAMNATNRIEVISGSSRVSNSATATMGPNSPRVPIAMMCEPNRVGSTPASRSMGIKVPRAVVVNASPTTRASRARPEKTRAKAAPRPITSEIPHPRVARRIGAPLILCASSS